MTKGKGTRPMAHLTRDAILVKDDIEVEEVLIPQWGGTVRVRGMSGTEREAFEESRLREKPSGNRAARRAGNTTTEFVRKNLRAQLVAWCVIDDLGARLFSDDDIPMLNSKSGAALERIVDVAMRLSGMGDDDVEELAQEMVENEHPSSASS